MNRSEIKSRAKAQLQNNIFGNYWMTAFLVSLLAGVIPYAAGLIAGIGAILVSGPIRYGLAYVFLKQARDGENQQVGDLFRGFTDDFAENFLLGLLTGIFTMLWSLLFIVPGIVKAYSYSFAFYIKADNPGYEWNTCINESKRLTSGHKWQLFMLDLSFIGWHIVGALCLGIGTLWVTPYVNASKAQFYREIVGR